LPDVDLLLYRDCLIHFSYADIARTLDNFLRSKIKHILTTSYPGCVNRDIATDDFRPIDLLAALFGLDAPIEQIDDWICDFPPPALCLWERERIGFSSREILTSLAGTPGRDDVEAPALLAWLRFSAARGAARSARRADEGAACGLRRGHERPGRAGRRRASLARH
jgi:hypothetical protein